eukprot:TRINITY_DN6063_c0_g1_i1.p1 TRINITY_DN6063_c0_g1~~TRINITY_DN6063_c0_g1_i1.p1  ORF type:complete len:198 (-),score=39.78 TRINITY_DN6063_c0_g1_i1:124-717(-)
MSLEKALFNLKFTSKQFQRMSKKAEKEERKEKLNIKKAIEKGNIEGAKIYAQNAIRQKNQALNYLRLASRLDAAASRVETAARMREVSKSMTGIVKSMDSALKSMNLEKITQVMDKFEKQFEDVDVQSSYIEGAIATNTALLVPEEQVDTLINQVADAHSLTVGDKLSTHAVPTKVEVAVKEEDELTKRLEALKSRS